MGSVSARRGGVIFHEDDDDNDDELVLVSSLMTIFVVMLRLSLPSWLSGLDERLGSDPSYRKFERSGPTACCWIARIDASCFSSFGGVVVEPGMEPYGPAWSISSRNLSTASSFARRGGDREFGIISCTGL
jgi:hypothetical protein